MCKICGKKDEHIVCMKCFGKGMMKAMMEDAPTSKPYFCGRCSKYRRSGKRYHWHPEQKLYKAHLKFKIEQNHKLGG